MNDRIMNDRIMNDRIMNDSTMNRPQVVILGGGPAGLGAAYKLAQRNRFQVTLLEQNNQVGGNAGSFELAGMRVDYGSHRLHPACDPVILKEIQDLLGDELLDRPRHGRIRLHGRWIHFPLKPADLALRLPPAFIAGVGQDMLRKVFSPRNSGDQAGPEPTFASVMEKGLGRTICRDFYFPYMRKIWGMDPEEISVVLARRRVSNSSLGKMMRKVLSALPGLKAKGAGRFYYPAQGYGQISEAYARAAQEAGAQILLGARVQAIELGAGPGGQPQVCFEKDGVQHALAAGQVWSTLPISLLARLVQPAAPPQIREAAQKIETRAMILVYLVLGQDQFSEWDAHYFPEEAISISRLSEPKNYGARKLPAGRTVLCAELPCILGGETWRMADEDLASLVCQALEKAGLPLQAPLLESAVRRLPHAYPVYRNGFEQHFQRLDEWVGRLDGVLTFGRQGLFAHDNTHHALFMAYSAVNCLDDYGRFDQQRWQDYRRVFETHVVED